MCSCSQPAPGGLANPLKLGVICEQALLLTVDWQIQRNTVSKVVKCLDMSIQAEQGGVQLLPTGSRWIDKSSGTLEEVVNKQQISETQTCGYRDDNLFGLIAAPHEVGLSEERLKRISSTAQGFIDEGQLAGAITGCRQARQSSSL